MKKYIICLLTATLLMSGTACSYASNNVSTDNKIKIIYNGENVDFDVAPINDNGTVLVPMRAVLEKFGASVKWDSETQTVSARKKSKTYTMTLGGTEITETKDGETTNTVTANSALQIVDGRTMIPLRALGEMLGLDVSWDDKSQTVTLDKSSESDDSWKENEGKIKLDDLSVDGDGISVDGNIIKITSGGDFIVSGTNDNAQIYIDTEDKVKIRLNGVKLTNTDGAAIYVKNADKVYITIEDGTENTISDGGTYSEDAETNACIYSKDDLEIKGDGILNINGNVHNGITVKDSLDISNGTLNIVSAADGIHVNDTAKISGGTVSIKAVGDGIQSESILNVTDGTINIECSGTVTVTQELSPGARTEQTTDTENEDESSKGFKAEWMMNISGGDINIKSNDTCIKSDSELDINGGTLTLYSESKKGIKGMEDVNINDGTINIEKSTEGIESKRILTVNGGDIDINASDDGMNAGGGNTMEQGGGPQMRQDRNSNKNDSSDSDNDMTPPEMPGGNGMTPPEMPSGNDMTPPEKPSGDNGMTPPEMSGGNNGMNAGGGNAMEQGVRPQMHQDKNTNTTNSSDGSSNGEMTPPEMPNGGAGGRGENAQVSTEHHIQINGGDIYINANGDGIDSNSSIVIDGGTITIDGPQSGGDSALDHDGLFQINGGTVIAVGSAGMIENPSDTSAQNTISAYVTANSGSTITIKDSNDKEVCSYTVKKNAGHIMFSSADVKQDETYTVYVDGEKAVSGTIDSSITIMGTATFDNGKGNQMNGGGFGGKDGTRENRQNQQQNKQ